MRISTSKWKNTTIPVCVFTMWADARHNSTGLSGQRNPVDWSTELRVAAREQEVTFAAYHKKVDAGCIV